MNTIRYVLAVVVVVTLPPALLYWFVLHPFASFWRTRGRVVTFTVAIGVLTAGMAALWLVRRPLVAADLGTNYLLMAAGILAIGAAIFIGTKRRKHLTWRILMGVPEFSSGEPGELLTQGLYGVVRNPRYVEVLLGTAGYALMSNYLGAYVVTGLCVPAIYFLVIIEERELRDRFGPAYDEYCARVPRFVPRRGARAGR